jgi:hypothetical protein
MCQIWQIDVAKKPTTTPGTKNAVSVKRKVQKQQD